MKKLGYQIRDLQDSTFASDASSWTYSNIRTGPVYTCWGYKLLGGYCVLGTSESQNGHWFRRVWSNLPAHNAIRVSFRFWVIDSWDSSDYFQLEFEGTIVGGWSLTWQSSPLQVCGQNDDHFHERYFDIFFRMPHTASTFTMRVISRLDEESCNESFGFRDVVVVADQNTPPSSSILCGVDSNTALSNSCGCNVGQYASGGSCYSCYNLCASCFGAGATNCYRCIDQPDVIYDGVQCVRCVSPCATCTGGSTNCLTCISGYYLIPWVNKCVRRCPWPLIVCTSDPTQCCSPSCSIDQFFMWDGVTCSSTCPAPYQPMTEISLIKPYISWTELPVIKLCLFPCSPIEYLYWDGTCGQDCGSPLTISTTYDKRKLCNFPCTYDYQYAYWDGSCASSCDPPRITHLQNGRRLCRQPCLDGQYFFWTGECMNTCPVYHTTNTVGGILYCNYPCGVTQFLYWDGVCRSTCPFPLNTRVQYSRQYCDYPTSSGNYLYWDGSSVSTCLSPFTGTSQYALAPRLFCDYDCEWGYTYWDLSCLSECPYPLTITIVKNRQYCGFSCTGSNYLYWNGTCSGSCNPPLVSRQYLGKNFCDYPCLNSQYLYWDGACSFTCSGIFVIRQEGFPMVRNFCDFPCLPEYYYYWNSSCISVCPPPLVPSTDRSRLYCNFPCLEGQFYYYNGTCSYVCDRDYTQLIMSTFEKYCVESSQYVVACDDNFYYWNNTCHVSCPPPLMQSTVGDQKWCIYPCLANQFLYQNGTCLDTCEPPFTERIESGYKYCDYSCGPSEYFYWNDTCLASCPMPLRHEVTSYGANCLLPCERETEYYDVNTGTCVEECASPSLATGDLYPICLPYLAESAGSYLDLILKAPETQNSLSLVTIPTVLASIRYINMPLPPRALNLVNSQGREIMSLEFGSDMPQSLQTSFTKRPLPDIFEQRGLHSSFIVNFWSKIMSWLLVITVLFFIVIFERLCLIIGWGSGRVYLESIKLIIKWNLCLEFVGTSVGDVVFYSLIEWISLDPHLSTSFASILLLFTVLAALTVMTVAIFNLISSSNVVRRRLILYKDKSAYRDFAERWKEFEVLFSGFRGHSNLNQYFFLLYMFRIAFPMAITVFLRSSPLAQTIIQVIFSFIIMSYILIAVPLARKINFLQLFIMEGLAFLVNLGLLLLCILNMVDAKHSREYNLLGDIVVGGCSTINLMEILFLIVKIFVGVRAIDQYIMTHPKYSRTIWLQLFAFVGQQGGMGFEEMFVDPEAERIFKAPKYLIGNGSSRVWAENQQALQDRARGAFAVSQPLRPTEQESTLASFFPNSQDVVVTEPIRMREDIPVGSISGLVRREDPPQAEVDPFYWLQGIVRLERHGPKNAKKPKTMEFSEPRDEIRDMKSHDSRKKRSPRKHKEKHGSGGAKIKQ